MLESRESVNHRQASERAVSPKSMATRPGRNCEQDSGDNTYTQDHEDRPGTSQDLSWKLYNMIAKNTNDRRPLVAGDKEEGQWRQLVHFACWYQTVQSGAVWERRASYLPGPPGHN